MFENQKGNWREELIAARARIEDQIAILENPLRFYGPDPEVVVKFRRMLADIDDCLAREESDGRP